MEWEWDLWLAVACGFCELFMSNLPEQRADENEKATESVVFSSSSALYFDNGARNNAIMLVQIPSFQTPVFCKYT